MITNNELPKKFTIRTFVFMDLEATGLFPQDSLNPLNSINTASDDVNFANLLSSYIMSSSLRNAPKITEISLVAVSRRSLENVINRPNSHRDGGLNTSVHSIARLPCNVYTCQINPGLNEEEWREYECKRIMQNNAIHYSRDDLLDKNNFAVEWEGVRQFLCNLPKPLCILAHNGIKYDFLVLYAELKRINQLDFSPLSGDIYFVDTYIMFMNMERKLHNDMRMLVECIDWRRLFSKTRTSELCEQKSVLDKEPSVTDEHHNFGKLKVFDNDDQLIEDSLIIKNGPESCQYKTPQKPSHEFRCNSEPTKCGKRKLFSEADVHPLQYIRMESWSPAKKIRLRTNFFRRNANGDWQFDNHLAMQYFHEKKVFRLKDMYRQITSRDFDAHHAQDDCEALMQVCIAYGVDFLDYVDKNGSKFPVLTYT